MVASNPHAGMASALDAREFDLLRSAIAEGHCRGLIGVGGPSEAADLWRPHPPCPSCGSPDCTRNGGTPAGRRRRLCPACGEPLSAFTGTALGHVSKELPVWGRLIARMRHNAPIDLIAEACEVAYAAALEWRRRALATVDGHQDRLVLSGRVWVDGPCMTDSDIVRSAGFAQRRGLPKDRIRIAVATGALKSAAVVACGHGRPSSERTRDALLSHMAPGSVIVRDMERPHPSLARAAKCTDEAYEADVNDPTHLEATGLVSSLCPWLRRYLFRFPGMRRVSLRSHLNWFVCLFRVRGDEEKWPRTARALRHLPMSDAHYRSSR